MNKNVYNYYVIDRAHRDLRTVYDFNLSEEYAALALSPTERMVRRFELLSSLEIPRIQPEEQIVFTRSGANIPDVFTEAEWSAIKSEHYIHELGYVSNLSPNYAKAISTGLLAMREGADEASARVIDAVIALSDRYCSEARKIGRYDVAEMLERVPRYSARSFKEALQFFRILHFSLWLEGDYHNTVGRFDNYMYPYFKADMESGVLTEDTALELLEDFFISFNKDSDLYVGVQQGDNGQSMVLGGLLPDGTDGFNDLSRLCLLASRNLKLIDPKINLRVSENTPIEIYELGTELTKVGLGFPQYSNDDVVIDGLVRLGYDYEDAVNYVVAACWEFIIPGVGNDIANIAALNFPKITDEVIRRGVKVGNSFDELLSDLTYAITEECDRICAEHKNIWFVPSPMMDLLRDGKKYNNFGIHGCGLASAADALAGVKKYLYDEKTVTPDRLINALDTDFANDPELLHMLRFEAPKMGTGDEGAEKMMAYLLDTFSDALKGRVNSLGGVYRAGTGTAMYYLWYSKDLGATADGRRKGEPFGTNFSPNLFTEIPGPITNIEAFSSHDMRDTVNGGPLTVEFTSSVFANPENISKVAALIKYFIERGGHQLQLNAVNLETMKEAQRNPDAYRQLVVRIWGWSAYFVELDKEYQDHVMSRQEYSV